MTAEYLSNEFLKAHLQSLSEQDQKALQLAIKERLATQHSITCTEDAVRQILRIGANSVLNEIRAADSEPCSYLEVLSDCCDALKAKPDILALRELKRLDGRPFAACKYHSHIESAIVTLEETLLVTVFQKTYASLSDEQKRSFDNILASAFPEQGRSISSGLAATGGALVLGNLGGFGTYMAMSSLLSTISFGTLGFGAYTAASSLLSVALGPVGWAAFGAVLVRQVGTPNMSHLVQGVAMLAMAGQSKVRNSALSQNVVARIQEDRRLEIERDEKHKQAVRARFAARPKPTGFFDSLLASGEELLEDVGDVFVSSYSGIQTGMDSGALEIYQAAIRPPTAPH